MFEDEPKKEEPVKAESKIENVEVKNQPSFLDLNDFEDAPVLPTEQEDEDVYDLQKELEAKFDELFGPLEDDNN